MKRSITVFDDEEGEVRQEETENETLWYLEHLTDLERDRRQAIREIVNCHMQGDNQGMREWAVR